MSVLQEVHQRLVLLESKLHDRPDEAGEVRAIRQLLDSDESGWIDIARAQRLLDAYSVGVVETWAKRGWLRSKQLPDGQLKVSLEDVLAERQRLDALSLFGLDREMTEEEYELSKQPAPPEIEAIVQELVEKSRQSNAARGNSVSE